jgi:hypothetical protein
VELPLEISATDSFGSVTDPPVRRLAIVARQQVSLARVLAGEEMLCETFDRSLAVSRFLLERAPEWLGEEGEGPGETSRGDGQSGRPPRS